MRELLGSFRAHYKNLIFIIDGSSEEHYPAIKNVCDTYPDVHLIHFDYNIHHGPGLAWAYQNLDIQGPVLILDSDVIVLRAGLLEALVQQLKPGMYGVGYVNHVNEGGFDVNYEVGAVRYLHPACMLCNMEVLRQWPMPAKHGAPNIEPMLAIHRAGKHELIEGVPWVKDDFALDFEPKHYLRHDWQGTVKRTGGYHLEEWQNSIMNKLPIPEAVVADEPTNYNHDLLPLIPRNARGVVEVGSNNGALAKAYKAINPNCRYTGIEIDAANAERSRRYCNDVLTLDIESVEESFYAEYSDSNVWIFGDVLEHLRYPWEVLARIRRSMPSDGCVIVCLPNAQHWSVQAKLCVGDFRYENGGLMDRTHMRFFTRATMLEMIAGAGLKIEQAFPRIFGTLENEQLKSAIRTMATAVGADPELALQDSMPLQYVFKLVPA